MKRDDKEIVNFLLKTAKENGANTVGVRFDDEEERFGIDNPELMELLDNLDDAVVEFYDGKENLGSFYLVFGNEDYTTVCDYVLSDWAEKVGAIVEKKFWER